MNGDGLGNSILIHFDLKWQKKKCKEGYMESWLGGLWLNKCLMNSKWKSGEPFSILGTLCPAIETHFSFNSRTRFHFHY